MRQQPQSWTVAWNQNGKGKFMQAASTLETTPHAASRNRWLQLICGVACMCMIANLQRLDASRKPYAVYGARVGKLTVMGFGAGSALTVAPIQARGYEAAFSWSASAQFRARALAGVPPGHMDSACARTRRTAGSR